MAGRRDLGSPELPACICSHIALHKATFPEFRELGRCDRYRSITATIVCTHKLAGLRSFMRAARDTNRSKHSFDGLRKA